MSTPYALDEHPYAPIVAENALALAEMSAQHKVRPASQGDQWLLIPSGPMRSGVDKVVVIRATREMGNRAIASGETGLVPGVVRALASQREAPTPLAFDPKANLERTLEFSSKFDANELAAASAALARLDGRQSEDPEAWASRLSEDLSAFQD